MRFDLAEVLELTGATAVRWPGGAPATVQPTHSLGRAGPGALYFPMHRGRVGDAALRALVRTQAAGLALFPGQAPPPPEQYPELGVLALTSPPAGFFRLAAAARRRSEAMVVGVTGTAGKSSTKEFLAAILGDRYQVHATRRSYNLASDCAELLLGLEGGAGEAAVIEMGLGNRGDVDRMAGLARPLAGVITKVTGLEWGAGAWEVIAAEKGRLARHLPPEGFLALHGDDPGCALLPRSGLRARVFTFGAGRRAHARYELVRTDEQGTTLVLRLFGRRLPCRIRWPGAFQAANAAAAALVAHVLGVPAAEIEAGLAAAPPLPRRFAVYRFAGGLTVVDDTCSATTDAVLHGLHNAAVLAGPRRRVAVLGDVLLPAGTPPAHHRLVGEYAAASRYTDLLLLPGAAAAELRAGALAGGLGPEQIQALPHREQLLERLLALARPGTLIYCKGQAGHRLGPVVDALRAAVAAAGHEPLDTPAP